MGPEFNALWDKYFKDKPDKPVMFGSIVSAGVLLFFMEYEIIRSG